MKHLNGSFLAKAACVLGFGGLAPVSALAVTTSDFGAVAPSSNIILSTTTPNSLNANIQWRDVSGNTRVILPEFVAPTTFSLSGFAVEVSGNGSDAGLHFSLSIIQMTALGTAPTSTQLSSPLYTETGTLPATPVTANDFMQLTLDTPFTLTSGGVYGLELTLTDLGSSNTINLWQVSGATGLNAADFGALLISNNGGAFASGGNAVLMYVQGTAVPEPGSAALLGAAALLLGGLGWARRPAVRCR